MILHTSSALIVAWVDLSSTATRLLCFCASFESPLLLGGANLQQTVAYSSAHVESLIATAAYYDFFLCHFCVDVECPLLPLITPYCVVGGFTVD